MLVNIIIGVLAGLVAASLNGWIWYIVLERASEKRFQKLERFLEELF